MFKRVMIIIIVVDFKKMNYWLDSLIGDVKWVVNILFIGDECFELGGLLFIVFNDFMLVYIWE